MTQNSIALRPRQPHSAPGQRQRSSIDRIMVFTETESLSLHCNGLALHAHMQHEAAAQRSAGAARGLWVKGVAFLGGYGHERPRAYNTPPVKKEKASRVNQVSETLLHPPSRLCARLLRGPSERTKEYCADFRLTFCLDLAQ